ncbi:hypothetical protein [Novosphingobium album (ex Hu et al. 2023)]|uniref:Uncharacterized protein n=1 Tax=Novosphingobium album (ex Hu et al. 2023) TaxID=2930093 RepID=A0ABT0AZE7_9SPHN|nr:hypothetical protein [Novosphingobium album (ex Hu et al. 2023)]MCJ2178167.1 hypothetical protein [Novosphingobium album (ex Hu et al. 2023)]
MAGADGIPGGLALVLAALIASPAAAKAPAASGPDLSSCGAYRPEEGDMELERNSPLPVPPALQGMASANVDYMAVSALSGATLCILTREMESIEPPSLSADRRFFGFEWSGYEAGGYILVDRAGRGTIVETGARPVASPGGTRLASIEWSASGFGSLNGVLVLGVTRENLVELARMKDLPEGDDWQIDRWLGEDCFEISSLPMDEGEADAAHPGTAPRRLQAVRSARGGWTIDFPGTACRAR